MTDNVNHPSHYLKAAVTIEPIELTARLDSCLGQALQYVMRAPFKGNEIEDLKKAIFYLEKSQFVKIPWGKYKKADGAVFVLAMLFYEKTSDELTRNVLQSLFFTPMINDSLNFLGERDGAILAIQKRIEELEGLSGKEG